MDQEQLGSRTGSRTIVVFMQIFWLIYTERMDQEQLLCLCKYSG